MFSALSSTIRILANLFYPDRRIYALAKDLGFIAIPLAQEMQPIAEKKQVYFHGFADGNNGNAGLGRGHWNASGHQTAAELIARRLCADGA